MGFAGANGKNAAEGDKDKKGAQPAADGRDAAADAAAKKDDGSRPGTPAGAGDDKDGFNAKWANKTGKNKSVSGASVGGGNNSNNQGNKGRNGR